MSISKKVLISLPWEFLEEIDAVAAEEHRSRSELIREATRRYIAGRPEKRRPIDDPKVREAVKHMDEIARFFRESFYAGEIASEVHDSRYSRADKSTNHPNKARSDSAKES